jgi:hypothetical protein
MMEEPCKQAYFGMLCDRATVPREEEKEEVVVEEVQIDLIAGWRQSSDLAPIQNHSGL